MRLFILILLMFSLQVMGAVTYKKISELSTQAITSVATGDLIPIVDISEDETDAISINELDKRFYNDNFTGTATFDADVLISDGQLLTVTSSLQLKSYLIMTSPDDSCSACSVDNADAFTCTATTCP
jgi:hypothetical protein